MMPSIESDTFDKASNHRLASASSDIEEFARRPSKVTQILLESGAAELTRFSSREQFEHNAGSMALQQRQHRFLKAFGLQPSMIERFVSVESAAGVEERPDFDRLLRLIDGGQKRLVIAAFADRVARNWPHFIRIGLALERVGGIIVLECIIYDLATARGRHDFYNAANHAVFQSEQRVQRQLAHKCMKADELALAVPLSTGYCWASLEDPSYLHEIDRHHMRPALGNAPAGDRTKVMRRGQRHLALPYPDAEIYQSMILRRDVLLQTRDVRAVVDMIHSDSAWPRKHHVPHREKGNVFSLLDPLGWKDLREYKTTLQRHNARRLIARWFTSPSLYGIYAWNLDKDVELEEQFRMFGTRVWEADAMPNSLFRPEQRAIVRDVLRAGQHLMFFVDADLGADEPVARARDSALVRHGLEALLPEVRCSVVWRDDELCRMKLIAQSKEDESLWRLQYKSPGCQGRHPLHSNLSMEAQQLIVQIVLEQMTAETLTTAVSRIELRRSVEQTRVERISREIKTLDAHLAFVRRELFRAQRDGRAGLAKQLLIGLDDASERREQLARERAEAETGVAAEQALSDQDRARILALAERLPDLWVRAAKVPGLRASLMRVLITRVHTRRIATRTEYVEVEFPSGMRVGRLLCVSPVPMPRAWQQWCLERLRHQLVGDRLLNVTVEDLAEADRVAEELTAHCLRPNRGMPWRGADARAGAILALYDVDARQPEAPIGETLDELAHRTLIPVEALQALASKRLLGKPSWFDGIVRYQATEVILCRWFREYARRVVAAANGWPVEDTLSMPDTACLFGVHPSVLFRAEYQGKVTIVHDPSGHAWLRTSTIAALVAPALEDVVAHLGNPAIGADDFVPLSQYLDFVARVTGRRFTNNWLQWARHNGAVLSVTARRPAAIEQTRAWIYLPAILRGADDLRLASEWLKGIRPDLAAWSPVIMSPAVQRRRDSVARRAAARRASSTPGAPRSDSDTDGSSDGSPSTHEG